MFWTIVWTVLLFLWLWLLVTVYSSIFRSRDLSTGGKVAWALFVLLMPYIGAICYLLMRGTRNELTGRRWSRR